MPNRTSCVPAMLAVLFIALTPRAGGAESAGDDCVAKPNSAAPQGGRLVLPRGSYGKPPLLVPRSRRLKGATGGVTETAAICDFDAAAQSAAQYRHPRRSRGKRVVANVSTSPFISKGAPPTPQLNSDTRAEAAASELVANVSTFPSLSKGAPASTSDNAAETPDNVSLNFGATAGVSANAAAVRPPEVMLGVRATPRQLWMRLFQCGRS